MKATVTCPRNVCVCGFLVVRACVCACRRHLFVFRTTAAVNFAELCFVWSLLPSHSVNAVFLLSVTLKPLWSTVYSRSFWHFVSLKCCNGTVSQRAALSLDLVLSSSSSESTLFWNNCSLELRWFGSAGPRLSRSLEKLQNRVNRMSFILVNIHSPEKYLTTHVWHKHPPTLPHCGQIKTSAAMGDCDTSETLDTSWTLFFRGSVVWFGWFGRVRPKWQKIIGYKDEEAFVELLCTFLRQTP